MNGLKIAVPLEGSDLSFQLPVVVLGIRGRNPILRHDRGGQSVAVELRACRESTLRLQLLGFAPLENWAAAFPGGRSFNVIAAYDTLLRAAEAAGPFKGMVGWTA